MNTRNVFGNFLKDVKKIVKENNNKYSDLIIGEVVSADPLQVKINVSEGTLVLDKEFLSLTTLVQDFDTEIDIDFLQQQVKTEPTQVGDHGMHDHHVNGKKAKLPVKVYLGLKPGEKVMLLRVSNGQHYIVLDRLR